MNKKESILNLEQAERLINSYNGNPVYVYDLNGIVNNARRLNDAFSWVPGGFVEYYAVKANPNPHIIKLMTDLGCGCDCSSKPELVIANSLNSKMFFSANQTTADEFRLARDLGAIINFDDITHIPYYLNEVGELPETVCCRFNPGGEFLVDENCQGMPGESKYGMTRTQIEEAFRMLKENGVQNFGIHAFLASNTQSNLYYPMLARTLFELAVDLRNRLNINITFINLSGGIGIPYRPEEDECDINIISEEVRKAYFETFEPYDMTPAIYAELGRYMTGPYGQLYSKVVQQKNTYKNFLGMKASASNLMRPMMYGAYHEMIPVGKENLEKDHVYSIVGPLCENSDMFAIDRNMPKMEIGDIIAMADAGAHAYSMGYQYNARLRCAEVLYDSNTRMWREIRREETEDDYFSTIVGWNKNSGICE